jgi:hypothetical protein
MVDWRRLRLAAQLRATIEQLDQVIVGFEQSVAVISEQPWPEVQARQAIENTFRHSLEAGTLPGEVAPASWARFCENLDKMILARSDRRVRDHLAVVQQALEHIQAEIAVTPGNAFPRSVSLLQFCAGSLARRGFFQRGCIATRRC